MPRGHGFSRGTDRSGRSTKAIWRARFWRAKILAYSQGFTLLARAPGRGGVGHAARYGGADMAGGVHHSLERCSTTWRGRLWRRPGRDRPLAFAPGFARTDRRPSACPAPGDRGAATSAGLPAPALSAALQHFDQLRQARGTAKHDPGGLRDRFGAPRVRADRPAGRDRPSRTVGRGRLSRVSRSGHGGGRSPRFFPPPPPPAWSSMGNVPIVGTSRR